MKLKGWIAGGTILFAAAALACKDDPTSPEGTGTLIVRLVEEAPALSVATSTGADRAGAQFDRAGQQASRAASSSVDAVRVAVVGPTTQTANLTRTSTGFEGTIGNLTPGSYSLLVEGLQTGLVEFIGAATGINVVAGQTAEANVPIFTFVTTLDQITSIDDVNLTFVVTFTDIGLATQYVIEVSPDPAFPTDNTQSFTTTQTTETVAVPQIGTYFVRVRAGNEAVTPAEALPSNTRIVLLVTDMLTFGQFDSRTAFLTQPNQVDVYGFNTQPGDGIVVMAFSPEGLSPSSPLTQLGTAGAAAYGGATAVTSKEGHKAALTYSSLALLDLHMRLGPMFDASAQNPRLFGGNDNIGGQTFLSPNGDEMIVALANTTVRKAIELRAASGSGEYTVVLSKCDVFSVSVGQTFDGNLSGSDCIIPNPESVFLTYADLITFDGSAGDQVSLSLVSLIDPVLFLWGPDGTLLAANDDYDGLNSRIPSVSLPEDGTYVALATSFEEFQTGPYALSVADASSGAANQVVFTSLPSTVTVRTPFTVEVEIVDVNGFRVPTASADVTLSLVDNPGSLIFRASGASADGRMELVDPVTLDVLPPVTTGQPHIIQTMTYDGTTGMVVAQDQFADLVTIDPVTGIQTTIGTVLDGSSFSVFLKGLAFEDTGGRLFGADAFSDIVYEIDPETAAITGSSSVVAASTVFGFNGLAVDPTDGTLFAVARFDDVNVEVRHLVTIDPNTFDVTDLGQLAHDGVAGIAFTPSGRLYAVIGDGGRIPLPDPETLWTVDKTDPSVMTLETGLGGTGGGGESIATVPGQIVGATTVTSVNGVATFANVQINATGIGYTIAVSAPGLIGEISGTVDVNP